MTMFSVFSELALQTFYYILNVNPKSKTVYETRLIEQKIPSFRLTIVGVSPE